MLSSLRGNAGAQSEKRISGIKIKNRSYLINSISALFRADIRVVPWNASQKNMDNKQEGTQKGIF
jgi:hypothetical protein